MTPSTTSGVSPFFILAGSFGFLASHLAVAVEPTECQKALIPIERPAPEYPLPEQARDYLPGTSYLHIFVEGEVAVEFIVNPAGNVSDVRIIEATETPVGPNTLPEGHFKGFLSINVIPTVERWRYQPIEQPCIARASFVYERKDDE